MQCFERPGESSGHLGSLFNHYHWSTNTRTPKSRHRTIHNSEVKPLPQSKVCGLLVLILVIGKSLYWKPIDLKEACNESTYIPTFLHFSFVKRFSIPKLLSKVSWIQTTISKDTLNHELHVLSIVVEVAAATVFVIVVVVVVVVVVVRTLEYVLRQKMCLTLKEMIHNHCLYNSYVPFCCLTTKEH